MLTREEFTRLKRQACRWALDNGDLIKAARPKLPDALYNRAGDNWFPLLAIAEVISPEWGREAASVATSLNAAKSDESFSTQLLIGLQRIFKRVPMTRFFTTDEILTGLNSDKEAPWADWKNGLTAEKLSRMLKNYGIKSVRDKAVRDKRGYTLTDLNPVFNRYLSRPLENHPQRDTMSEDQVPEPISPVSGSKTHPDACHVENSNPTQRSNPLPQRNAGVCVKLGTKKGIWGRKKSFTSESTVKRSLSPENRYGTKSRTNCRLTRLGP